MYANGQQLLENDITAQYRPYCHFKQIRQLIHDEIAHKCIWSNKVNNSRVYN